MAPLPLPDQQYLLSRLTYDPDTGHLTWRSRVIRSRYDAAWNGRFAGARAGCVDPRGYGRLALDGARYKAHRVIWKMMTGNEPAPVLDHSSCVKDDNRWASIREASNVENNRNSLGRPSSGRGAKNVYWFPRSKQWRVRIGMNYRSIHLGLFDTLEEACAVATEFRTRMFGAFARHE